MSVERSRLLRPDAIVEVEDPEGATPLTYLIEFDRTRRVDKNYDKFRRYDCFLNWWWRYTDFGGLDDAPFVVFICQDRDHALLFLNAADHELTGNVSRPWSQDDDYVGRRRIAFCLEQSMYERSPTSGCCPSTLGASGKRAASGARSARGFQASEPTAARRLMRRPLRKRVCRHLP